MYQEFARVYDEFMQEISYVEWADYIERLWGHHGVKPSLVLDLACGTGGLTLELWKRGYEMIGADISDSMLNEAMGKAEKERASILYLQQDMREFELYGTVDSILCTCDSLNYLLDSRDIQQVFALANLYLNPGGTFIFDLNTDYKYKEVLGDSVFADTYEHSAFIWQNYYYPEEHINEYQVTFFEQMKEQPCYRRYEEIHYQRAYSVEDITHLLEEAGLRLEAIYDGFTLDPSSKQSERIFFVAREIKKNGENSDE